MFVLKDTDYIRYGRLLVSEFEQPDLAILNRAIICWKTWPDAQYAKAKINEFLKLKLEVGQLSPLFGLRIQHIKEFLSLEHLHGTKIFPEVTTGMLSWQSMDDAMDYKDRFFLSSRIKLPIDCRRFPET